MNAIVYIIGAVAAAVLGYVVLTSADEGAPVGGKETKIREVTDEGYWNPGVEAWLVEGRIDGSPWVQLIVVGSRQQAEVYALAWKQDGAPGGAPTVTAAAIPTITKAKA